MKRIYQLEFLWFPVMSFKVDVNRVDQFMNNNTHIFEKGLGAVIYRLQNNGLLITELIWKVQIDGIKVMPQIPNHELEPFIYGTTNPIQSHLYHI